MATANDISREQAIAMADLIEERMEAEYAQLLAARKPHPRITGYRHASALRRSARRIRAGLFRPAWMTESPEELASEYEYAAEYDDMMQDVRHVVSTHKRVQRLIASNKFAEVRDVFDDLKEWLDDPDFGRPKK